MKIKKIFTFVSAFISISTYTCTAGYYDDTYGFVGATV